MQKLPFETTIHLVEKIDQNKNKPIKNVLHEGGQLIENKT